MYEDFPYTNLHQLNLDWLVDVIEKLHDNMVISVNGQTGEVILYQNATMQLPNVDDRTWTIIRNTHGVKRGIKFDSDGTAYIVSGNSLASVFTPENPPASTQVTYDQYVRLTTLTDEQMHNWNIFRTLNNQSIGIEFDDTGEAYIISGSNRYRLYSTKNPLPTSGVTSVNGQTGSVVLYTDRDGEISLLPSVSNTAIDAWSIGRTINGTDCRIYIYTDGQVIITAGSNEYRLVNSEEVDILKDAIAAKLDVFFVDIANDKYVNNRSAGVQYSISGNKYTFDGTANGGVRIKLSNDFDTSTSVKTEWRAESIGLVLGHKYLLCGEYISGDGRITFVIYKNSGTGVSLDVNSQNHTPNNLIYSDAFIADSTNARCLCAYYANGRAFNNLVVRFNLIDLTIAEEIILNKIFQNNIDTLHNYYFINDYLKNRMSAISVLRANASINNASFLWFTDPHYFHPANTDPENGMQSIQLAEYLKKNLNNRYVICGGDLLRGTLTKDVCRDYLIKAREYMSPMYDNLFMCLGNHEYNNPGGAAAQVVNELHSPELYEMLCKHQEPVMDSVSEKADYSVIDKAQKIKYFILGCDAAHDMFPETITWFAQEMSNIESGYHVIVISHIGLTYASLGANQIDENFTEICNIIDAVNGRTTFTYSGVVYNYSNVNFEIVCALTGHVHYDGYALTTGGTPIIATTCDRAFVGSDGDAGVREVRKIGTIGEQALDYVLIDFENHTIDTIRIGGSILGASYDDQTGKIYETSVGTTTEYTGTEWVEYSPYKDRHFTYTGHIT